MAKKTGTRRHRCRLTQARYQSGETVAGSGTGLVNAVEYPDAPVAERRVADCHRARRSSVSDLAGALPRHGK